MQNKLMPDKGEQNFLRVNKIISYVEHSTDQLFQSKPHDDKR